MGSSRKIDLLRITADPRLQMRVKTDEEAVEQYRAIYAGEVPGALPPLAVVQDKLIYWLIDGFHRRLGAELAGLVEVEVIITPGDFAIARDMARAANRSHGVRLANADKRRIVETALEDKRDLSDHAIAEHCGVSQPFVSKIRHQLAQTDNGYQSTERIGRDGRTTETANIGKGDRCPLSKLDSEAAPTTVPEPQTDDLHALVLTDGEGLPVGEPLLATWEALAQFDELESLLRKARQLVHEIATRPGGEAFRRRRCQLSESHGQQVLKLERLQTALYEIQSERPYVACCPHCHVAHPGQVSKSCRACLGTGWLTEQVWKSAPEDCRRLVLLARKREAEL